MNSSRRLVPRTRRSGFTLIETLAVLAVIAAIIAIGVPAIAKVLQSARIRNAEGTANVVKSALLQYLSKPGSPGTLPVTEGSSPALAAEYTGSGTPSLSTIAAAATLDNVLLSEGVLERPIALRLGAQNTTPAGNANGFAWAPATESFTSSAPPTLNFSAVSRVECAVSDGVNNPGSFGQTAGSAACAFNLNANGTGGTLIPSGTRVAYLLIKAVPDADAYQLALDVDGLALVQNSPGSPAGADQPLGPVEYARDAAANGYVDVFYYLTSI
jgi:prepilin-type N-terminal cleavage/methylation domain-containing protein